MSFAVADEEENSDLFHEFGFDDSSEEVNVGILGLKDRKYPMDPMEEYESDEVERFLKTFMKGIFIVSTVAASLMMYVQYGVCCVVCL